MKVVQFFKKQSIGFYLSIAAIIVSIVSMILFFRVDPTLRVFLKKAYVAPYVVCSIFAILLQIAIIVLEEIFAKKWEGNLIRDIVLIVLNIVSVILFAFGLVEMIWSGIYETAMAMGSQLGDHQRANFFLAVVIVNLVSFIFAIASSFTKTLREEKTL